MLRPPPLPCSSVPTAPPFPSRPAKALDLISSLLLILAASNMEFVQDYRLDTGIPGLSRVLTPVLIALAIWIGRTAEIAFLADREV